MEFVATLQNLKASSNPFRRSLSTCAVSTRPTIPAAPRFTEGKHGQPGAPHTSKQPRDSLLDQMSIPKFTMLVVPPDMEQSFGRSVEFLTSTGHIQAATKAS